MSKFKEGDKVRIIKEPVFITMKEKTEDTLGVWKFHPDTRKEEEKPKVIDNFIILGETFQQSKYHLARVDLTHLIGVACSVRKVFNIPLYPGGPSQDIYHLRIPPKYPVPVGMENITDDYLELI